MTNLPTSDKVLAEMLSHMHAMLVAQQEMLETLQRAIAGTETQGRLLATCRPDPPNIEIVGMLGRNGIPADYDSLSAEYTTLLGKLGGEWDGTIASNNIMLKMALGPDAPQFRASGEGWELWEVCRE